MEMNRETVIKELQTRDFVFVAYSQATKLPYVTCGAESYNDQAWFFSTEEGVKEFGKKMLEDKILLMGMKFEKKNYNRLYGILYSTGINSIIWNDEDVSFEVELINIAQKADMTGIEPEKRPLVNPELQLSGMYFMQELKRPIDMEERTNLKELKEMEEELLANLIKAQFLIGANVDPENPDKVQIPYLKNKEEKKLLPAFSDILEYDKFSRGKNMKMYKVAFEKLPELMVKESDAVVINPLGFNLIVTREMFNMLLKKEV